MFKVRSDNKSVKRLLVFSIATVLVIVADLVTKQLVIDNMQVGDSVTLISGFLRITYILNSGAAFGLLSQHRWIFLVVSVAIIAAILIYAIKKGLPSLTVAISLGLVAGGGIGNMIERVRLGYVTDMIDFVFLPFWKWIFNLADACVCVGAVILVLWFVFSDVKNKKEKKTVDTKDMENDN